MTNPETLEQGSSSPIPHGSRRVISTKKRAAIASSGAAIAIALVLAGCGSSSDASSAETSNQTTPAANEGSETHEGGSEGAEAGGEGSEGSEGAETGGEGSEGSEGTGQGEANETHNGNGEAAEGGVVNLLTPGDSYDETINGARLILNFDAAANEFVGTVENTTNGPLTRARVEVHLSNGTELGPTTPTDLAAGETLPLSLASTTAPFDTWSAHPEVGAAEAGGDGAEGAEGGEGSESGGEESGEHGSEGEGSESGGS